MRYTDEEIREIIIARKIAEKEAKEKEYLDNLKKLSAFVCAVWIPFVAWL